MKKYALFLILVLVLGAGAAEIALDGKLDEAIWQKQELHTGFVKAKLGKNPNEVKAQTEFRVIKEADSIVFGIKCHEPMMAALGNG